ncbi:hypothetical protein NEHOM01_0176 [Nematocida homosporus]|uniref:uncharacterized protein n=1 Tax=Nematocida homosporus TaxID=1912981 RepID=UPI00221EB0B4|nr:uncharacterized protein NEHOM01_0176 [Nematocida homosporus]KAI5184431.1 hypothetical protein NEHOM01_0176 [Nematocida homosporus]
MQEQSAGKMLERLQKMSPVEIRRERSQFIAEIARGRFSESEKLTLRMELQKRLLESRTQQEPTGEIGALAGAEKAITAQCEMSAVASRRLAESDAKLMRIKSTQDRLAQEMDRAEKTIQKRKSREFRDDIAFLGALGLFFAVCIYVLLSRLVLK